MKSARVSLWNAQASQNPKAPILTGTVELPAQLVWELSQLMQSGQGLEVNQQSGEQFFKLRVAMWRGTGENDGPVLYGQIDTPAERQAYLAQKAAQGGQQPWGAPAAPVAAPQVAPAPPAPVAPVAPAAPAWGAPPAAPVPAAPAWGAPPAAPVPAAAPVPDASAWGAPAPGGWGA